MNQNGASQWPYPYQSRAIPSISARVTISALCIAISASLSNYRSTGNDVGGIAKQPEDAIEDANAVGIAVVVNRGYGVGVAVVEGAPDEGELAILGRAFRNWRKIWLQFREHPERLLGKSVVEGHFIGVPQPQNL